MSNLFRLVACLFFLLSFNAFAVDTDGDGFSDADEATLGTDPNDPTSPLEDKLTASDGTSEDYFGRSVSIDGDTAVIGAFGDDDNDSYSGSAYVYVRSNGVWTEQQKLTASDGAWSDRFGISVSIDGDTAVIGAYYDDDDDSGSAYVYVRSNGVWSEQQKLTASDGASGDNFGISVSIDGDTAVIGADGDDDNGSNSGSAYVYVRSNGVWSEQQKLTASDGAESDYFGYSVSIDGDTAVIGAFADDDNGTSSGSAYVYVRSNGVWSEQAKLTASDAASDDYFGYSVSIDGDTAVIGAQGDDDNNSYSGSAYVYVRSNGVWSEQQKLTASDGASGDSFGFGVSIDGDTAVIGAQGFYNDSYSGSAYVYVRSNGVWSEQQKLTASDGAGSDNFGYSVSIDGDTAVIGAQYDDDNGSASGSAYIFPLTPPHQDTSAVITGSLDGNTTQGGFTFGSLQATDVDGLTDGTYFTVSNAPLYGQAQINPSTGLWTYLAGAVYVGADPFTVTVTDDLGGTTEQVVSITITAPDSDGDGTYDFQDNCPSVSNADQANLDNDTFGDACDSDIDGDGTDNAFDAFPNDATESSDSDSDNVGDNADNCVNAANADQANLDGDAFGDACDSDIDGDGTDNAFDAFPNDSTESADSDADNVGDNSDNCIYDANADQANLDGDALGDACDSDMDGDGVFNVVELRFGGNEADNTDASVSQNNIVTFSETAPADSDLDGVPDDVEAMLGEDNTSSTFQDLLDTLSIIATAKNVPAMGGIGLLALGLSMLGLGAVRMKRK